MSKIATKALIDEKITGNGVQAITGPILNNVLNTMVDDYGTQDELSQLRSDVTDDISQLGQEVNGGVTYETVDFSDYEHIEIGIDGGSNLWINSSPRFGVFVPVSPGDRIRITGGTNTGYFAVLKSDAHTEGTPPQYATGYTERVTATTQELTIPEDGSYIYVYLKTNIGDVDSVYELGEVYLGHEQRIQALEGEVTDIGADLDEINGKIGSITSIVSASAGVFPYSIVSGKTYKLVNKGGIVTISHRETPDGTSHDVINLAAGKTREYVPTSNGNYLRYGDACNFTIEDVSTIESRLAGVIENESGDREDIDVLKREIEKTTFESNAPAVFPYHFVMGKQYLITCYSDIIETSFSIRSTATGTDYDSTVIKGKGGYKVITASVNAEYLRVGDKTLCTVEDYDSIVRKVGSLEKAVFNYGGNAPAVRFDFGDSFIDPSAELAGMDFSLADIMEQIYTKFDALVSAYPSYVSKVDAASSGEADLPYPSYANLNGEASGDYLATPSYKTYMYKLGAPNSMVNTKLKKKKLFLVGGNHGNEIAAPFNLYLFAKKLCESTINDYFALRASFDIYIIPCLNGYGMYHAQRCNANNVNINRNFPVAAWSASGDPTNPQGDYTGASAGSEFETQLVMALVDKYSPDIVIDHHNYSRQDTQFYTEFSYERFLPLSHKSLVDCSRAFIKNLPLYFGTSFKLFMNIDASVPHILSGMGLGYMQRWAFEAGLPFAATIEVADRINYLNGDYHTSPTQDHLGADTFAIAEYTLRNQICLYGGLILGEAV